MANRKFQKMQQAMFRRAAKMMSYELRVRRAYYEAHKPRRYKRVCEYVMHVQYYQVVEEVTEVLR